MASHAVKSSPTSRSLSPETYKPVNALNPNSGTAVSSPWPRLRLPTILQHIVSLPSANGKASSLTVNMLQKKHMTPHPTDAYWSVCPVPCGCSIKHAPHVQIRASPGTRRSAGGTRPLQRRAWGSKISAQTCLGLGFTGFRGLRVRCPQPGPETGEHRTH